MKLSIILCSLLSALAIVSVANARISLGTVEGFVLDVHGNAAPGATVTIQTSDGNHPHATRTDDRGHFEFARFETGQYDLRAYFNSSYSDWAKRIVIHSNKATKITLRIAPGRTAGR
jgi:hypothetical protein